MSRTPRALVAARTRTAEQILTSAELLALYEAKGGLRRDLETVRDAGRKAEAWSLAQRVAKGEGSAATVEELVAFAALQREYTAVMAVLQAVRGDLARINAPAELIAVVDQILVNEAPVAIRTGDKKKDDKKKDDKKKDEDGKKKREEVRSLNQEALRAEIAKNAATLLALDGVQAALAERKVDAARLTALKGAADALSGKLANRATQQGAKKAKSKAAKEQSAQWNTCSRLLSLVAQQDQRVAQLLKKAARPDTKDKDQDKDKDKDKDKKKKGKEEKEKEKKG